MMRWQGILVGITALLLASALVQGAGSEPRGEISKDRWCGEYTQLGGISMERSTRVSITKEGDHYRISLKPYQSFKFVEVKPGVLESKSLGKIYRGTLRFDDRKPSTPVLRAEFCYEWFYLFGESSESAVQKPD